MKLPICYFYSISEQEQSRSHCLPADDGGFVFMSNTPGQPTISEEGESL